MERELKLGRLHKYLTEICKLEASNFYSFSKCLNLSVLNTNEWLKETHRKSREQHEQNLLTDLNLKEDETRLKEAIFQANVESGVNRLFNRLIFLRYKYTLYSGFNKDGSINPVKMDSPQYSVILEKLRDENKQLNREGVMIIELFSNEEIEQHLNDTRKEIRKAEDEIDRINSEWKVKITLHESTLKMLGL